MINIVQLSRNKVAFCGSQPPPIPIRETKRIPSPVPHSDKVVLTMPPTGALSQGIHVESPHTSVPPRLPDSKSVGAACSSPSIGDDVTKKIIIDLNGIKELDSLIVSTEPPWSDMRRLNLGEEVIAIRAKKYGKEIARRLAVLFCRG